MDKSINKTFTNLLLWPEDVAFVHNKDIKNSTFSLILGKIFGDFFMFGQSFHLLQVKRN